MKRIGRRLRLLTFALPLLAVACASSADSGGTGPSTDRQLDVLGLVAGCAVLLTIGILMYIDNQD